MLVSTFGSNESNGRFSRPADIEIVGRTAFVVNRGSEAGLFAFDLSDPARLELIGYAEFASSSSTVSVVNGVAVAGDGSGFSTFDVSDCLIPLPCPGDATGDRTIDGDDLLAVVNNFGVSGADDVSGDVTDNGTVDGADLLAVINNFGQNCGG